MKKVVLAFMLFTGLLSCQRDAEMVAELTTNARRIIGAALTDDSATVVNAVADSVVERHVYLFVRQEPALAVAATHHLRYRWHSKTAEADTAMIQFRISVDNHTEVLQMQFAREQEGWLLYLITLPDRM